MNDDEKNVGNFLFDLKRKSENFWYYYKWHTIIGVVVLIFLILTIKQCNSSHKTSDVNVSYIGQSEFLKTAYPQVEEDFCSILETDLNDDGELYCQINNFLYMTDKEIEIARAENIAVNVQELMTIKKQIDNEIFSGNTVIYFMSASAYKEFSKTKGMFMTLEEALGYVPDKNLTESPYTINLNKLYCYEYFAGIYEFPSDTVVVVRDYPTTINPKDFKTAERYERNLKFFKKLVEFQHPEGEIEESGTLPAEN